MPYDSSTNFDVFKEGRVYLLLVRAQAQPQICLCLAISKEYIRETDVLNVSVEELEENHPIVFGLLVIDRS